METRKVELSSFYSTATQEEGVWFEPKINGVGIGIEFKVTGREALHNEYAREIYAKDLEKIKREYSDPIERLDKMKHRLAEQTAEYVVGIRGVPGVDVTVDGKPLEFSKETVTKLFYENYGIQNQVMEFSFDTENFLNRKK